MELPGPLDHSFDARAMNDPDLCHRSNISCISYLWIYTSLHFSTVNKTNNRNQKSGSMTGTFIGCRTRKKLKAERVNKSSGRASDTCMGNCCTLCFTVVIISVWGQREWTSSWENEVFAVMQDQPCMRIWCGQQTGDKMRNKWRTNSTFGYESYFLSSPNQLGKTWPCVGKCASDQQQTGLIIWKMVMD